MLAMKHLLSWVLAQFAAAALATTVHDATFVPDHVLRVSTATIEVACEKRLSVVVNGTSPGPEIRLRPGMTSWIRVYNDMPDQNLTIHWHGMAQRMAPFADGSPYASQWPIAAFSFFDYEVYAELLDSATYLYHSHVKSQALTAFGPLIVDDCGPPPFSYDEERTLMLSDYFNKTDREMDEGLLAHPFVWTGETNAVLLNGMGVASGHTAQPWNGACDGICGLPVIDVDPGKTYRFRFIGATGLSYVSLAIEGTQNLTIVQADGGEYNKPVSVDHLQIGSGQRFDVLFQAKTAAELAAENRSTYYIQYETRDRPTLARAYAVIRYNKSVMVPGAPDKPVVNLTNTTADWLEYQLTPLFPEHSRAPKASEVTRRLIIRSVQRLNPTNNLTVWEFNNLSWTETTLRKPLLVDIYERGDEAVPDYQAAIHNQGWDPRTSSFPALVGEVIEIVFQNTGSLLNAGGAVDVHSMHAHGSGIWDNGSGDNEYDPIANDEKMRALSFTPVKRDTTMLPRYASKVRIGQAAGWRAWRIRFESPGVWMIHCHMSQHIIMGMQTVWVVGTASDIRQIPLEESQGYLTYGGSVYGNDTHSPIVHEFFDSTIGTCAKAWRTRPAEMALTLSSDEISTEP